VLPKRHLATIAELSHEELSGLFELAETIKGALTKVFGAEGFNCAFNQGEVAGQSIPHFHLHIVPRMRGDAGITEYEPRKFLYRPGSREASPEKELIEVAALIRSAL
jgi:diadenosine tetraphosphate (Ap4A) HIT family hydrolase